MEWSMSTFAVLIALIHVSSAVNKIQIYSHPEGKSYVTADEACQSKGGHLASVRDKEAEADVQYLLKAFDDFKPKDCLMTGLLKVNKGWIWRDNTTADYINWAPGFPKKEGRCGCYRVIEGKAKMINTYCLNVNATFHSCEPVKKTETKSRLPTMRELLERAGSIVSASEDSKTAVKKTNAIKTVASNPADSAVAKLSCEEGWSLFNNSCFKEFYGAPVRRWEAAASCEEMGSELVSIASEEEAKFLVELSDKGNYRQYGSQAWIGLTGKPTWCWNDGSHSKVDWIKASENITTTTRCAQLIVHARRSPYAKQEDVGKVANVDCESTSGRYLCEHHVGKVILY